MRGSNLSGKIVITITLIYLTGRSSNHFENLEMD
jgi:hypothetical protein